ncbi:hypothetical protein ACFL54_05675 [Planctomycetota bacterium]
MAFYSRRWETIDPDQGGGYSTHRLKVYGGWIVKSISQVKGVNNSITASVTFIPDLKHEWELDPLSEDS